MDYDYSAASTSAIGAGVITIIIVYVIFLVAVLLISIISFWKIYLKAGKPGWACIVPIYGYIVLLEIIGKPIWWLIIILFVPFANIVFIIMAYLELGEVFGKSKVWSFFMLILLPVIGLPILAFGSAEYTAPVASTISPLPSAPPPPPPPPTPPLAAAPPTTAETAPTIETAKEVEKK